MNFWSRYNPANNLYIKLFLWFWFATVIMVSSSAWVINKLNDDVRFKPVRQPQLIEVDKYSEKLQALIDSEQIFGDIERVLVQIGMQNQLGLILVDPQNNEIISGLPHHIRPDKASFTSISPDTPVISVDTGEGPFWGPGIVHYNNTNYMLFIGKPKPPGFIGSVRRQHPGVMLSIALCISGFLCFVFARSLVNPIRQLQHASQQMAAGNLTSRVGSASLRHDEIGRLGRDFNIMSEQVEILLTSQKRLLADISHELRTPLTRLQLSIGIVQQQAEQKNDEFLRTSLDRIEKEASLIEQMIAQVLTLSRLEYTSVQEDKTLLNVKNLLQPIISDAQFEAQGHDKEVAFECPDNINVLGNARLLSSAIENVLRNAVKYATHHITVSVTAEGRQLMLKIDDDGLGIEPHQLERIFEPFYRESLARDRKSGGIGLGLAIAQRAIIQHHGVIQASNKPQGGLVVNISLPLDNVNQDNTY